MLLTGALSFRSPQERSCAVALVHVSPEECHHVSLLTKDPIAEVRQKAFKKLICQRSVLDLPCKSKAELLMSGLTDPNE